MTFQHNITNLKICVLLGLTLSLCTHVSKSEDLYTKQAKQILEDTGLQGGLVVHLGCRDGKLTAALCAGDNFLVHGLDLDPINVQRARTTIQSLGMYRQVSIDCQNSNRLPYTDNLINLLVADNLGETTMDEVLRVLSPNSAAYIKQDGVWKKIVKSQSPKIDEWTHTLYNASNNAVSRDTIVAPPYHIQWVGEPRRARQHESLASISAVVTANGRIFSIQDEGSIASIVTPAKWFLVARDAFNGIFLWKKTIAPWEGHLRAFRDGPPEIGRRLVAIGNRVYVTLGYGKPVSQLDAATGEVIQEYRKTDGALEFVNHNKILYIVVGETRDIQAIENAKRRGINPPPQNKRIMAIETDSGDVLWEKNDADTKDIMPTTICVNHSGVYFQNPKIIIRLDKKTGDILWKTPRIVDKKRPGWSAPTLVLYKDVVMSADRAAPGEVECEPARKHQTTWVNAPLGDLIALSVETGEKLWSHPCRENFNAPVDILIADGLVWSGEMVVSSEPGITVGRDPFTGEIKRSRPADNIFFNVGMPHHRCYRNRAVANYLMLGRAGVEFIDVKSGTAYPNHWIRGTCQHGIIPGNGLLYVPPHSCACYTQAKLNGFYGLAPKRDRSPVPTQETRKNRLERGPSYPAPHSPSKVNDSNWPTYRHDIQRSGSYPASLPKELVSLWKAHPGGKLSGITVADGRMYIASIDTHTVFAFDAEKGKPLWQFTAGGRIDSPPTICKGLVLFGSADGYVYCLLASDGSLIWRFQAAPEDRRIIAYGQLESVWPVHGSVLVQDKIVYFAAGRSSYLDGGIYLYGLDINTGALLSKVNINSRDSVTGRQPKGSVEMFDLPGVFPGILSSDDKSIYMRHLRFDSQGNQQEGEKPHLFCPTGLLDDSWWHRSYWIYGNRFYTGYRDWFRSGREVPAGRILVFDESMVYGFGRKPEYYYWSAPLEYHLFATHKDPQIVDSPEKKTRVPEWGQKQIQYQWSIEVPFHVRAMLLADKRLFIAGAPDQLDEEEAYRNKESMALQSKLFEHEKSLVGLSNALLWIVSTVDGTKLAEYPLDRAPVWDGMAAANDRLFISSMDGSIQCFGKDI